MSKYGAKHLTLPYQTTKLAPKCHGPFRIIKQISPVTYKLKLPSAWTIHLMFHASLLTPYQETSEHGTNYQHLPPEMIDDQEEYEVEQVISHHYHGHKKASQYLIHWKGYSVTDDTWEPADQVFTDTLVKAYHRKQPLKGEKAPTFATHLCAALAKSHWCPHNPLMNFGMTSPMTRQDCIGAPKISAPMVPFASGTTKNTSTPMPCAAAQPTKFTSEANVLERSMSRRSIHRSLVNVFACLPHTPLPSPTAPTSGQITMACCNMPLNVSKLPATPVNAALPKPSIVPGTKTGHFPQPWRASSTAPSKWNKLLPSSVVVQLLAKWEGDVMAQLACIPENCRDMCKDPMMGSGGLPEGRSESRCPRMEAGVPLEGRLVSNNEVSMSHGCSGQDSDYPACQPILAQSMQCEDESSSQEVAQWSLDTSVSMMIVHD